MRSSGAPPIAYTIRRAGGLELTLALVELGGLLLHEETIPASLQSLAHRIEEDGRLRDPVVVDRETLVVLDGMHRVEALRLLGCRFICACLLDYRSPEVTVERWCRTVAEGLTPEGATELAKKIGVRMIPREQGGAVDEGGGPLLLFRGSAYDLAAAGSGPSVALDAVRLMERELREMRLEVEYETELRALERLARGVVGAILCPPKIGKEQVVETAKVGRIFPFKATRHIIPARPLGVDVPLSLLRDRSLSEDEANRLLSEMLKRRRLRHLPSGASWNGRYYDEDLYVFE